MCCLYRASMKNIRGHFDFNNHGDSDLLPSTNPPQKGALDCCLLQLSILQLPLLFFGEKGVKRVNVSFFGLESLANKFILGLRSLLHFLAFGKGGL